MDTALYETIRKSQHCRIIDGMHQLYKNKQLTDVILEVEGTEFPCNRNVLSASSPYFRAMFTSGVKESYDTKIPLHGVSSDAITVILDFMYSGELNITNENVQNLFVASNFFEMLDVVNICIEHISNAMNCSNCIDIFFFACYNFCDKLKESSGTFILRKFTEIAETPEFLSKVEVENLEWFISSDEIYVEKEEFIFNYILKWIQFDKDNRTSSFPKLFKHVRLPLVSEDFFKTEIIPNSFVQSNAFCKSILSTFELHKIQSSLNNQDGDCRLDDFMFANPKPRLGMYNRNLLIFSGGAFSVDERSLTAFDPITKKNYYGIKPHPSFDFKFRIDYFCLVTSKDNDIYFLGGIFYENYHFEDTGKALNEVYVYDQKQCRWMKQKPMLQRRCVFAACAYGREIYACGGKSSFPRGDAMDSVEVYDPDIPCWSTVSAMPACLYSHAVAIHENAMFVVGGKDIVDEHVDTMYRYDIPGNTWTIVRSRLMKPRAEHRLLPMHNKLFVVGGGSKHSNALEVEIYDPQTNRWKYGDDFKEERKILASVVHEDKIFVCGGVRQLGRTNKPTRHVESKDLHAYDAVSDSWDKLVKLVQYANIQTCTVAKLNIKFLHESDFISS